MNSWDKFQHNGSNKQNAWFKLFFVDLLTVGNYYLPCFRKLNFESK